MSKWRELPLGEVVRLQRGYDLPARHQRPGDVPVMGSAGQNGTHDIARATGPGVVIGRSGVGSMGVVSYSPIDYWPHNTVLFVTDFLGNDVRFVYYLLRTINFSAMDTGAAQKSLNRNIAYKHQLRVPRLPTQRKIASILSAYDDLIENNTRRIAILEEMAQAIYREWFVNFRFPGHENVKLVDSPLGQIPEGWEVSTLGDCLSVLETGNRPKGGVGAITEGVVSIGAESIVGAGQFDFSRTKFIPTEYFEKMRKGIVEDRDVLVYKDGGKPGYFIPHVSFFGNGFPFQVMALNSHVYRLRGSDGVSQEFLYYHLSSEEMLHWMHLNGSGAAIPSIARKDLVRLPVVLPPQSVMKRFTDFAGDCLSQILTTARKSQNLRITRDLLLPKLISGKLDVEDLDIDVGRTAEALAEATA